MSILKEIQNYFHYEQIRMNSFQKNCILGTQNTFESQLTSLLLHFLTTEKVEKQPISAL